MAVPPLSPFPRTLDDPDRLMQALREAHELLTLAEQSAGIGIWDRDVESNLMRGTPTFYRLMGLEPHAEPVHMDVVRAVRHPDDAPRVVDGFQQALARGDDVYESEYRIIRPSDGQLRWIFGRGRTIRDADGKVVRYSGVDIDITERKQAEAHVRLLMQEVNHRANNLLAVVQAMAQHLADSAHGEDFVGRLSRRLSALAASNNLLVSGKWQGVELARLVESQLLPFAGAAGRVTASGPSLRLKPAAAQAIGMALHELATNAAKHGALSNLSGTITLDWQLDGAGEERSFAMDWREGGGPLVAPPRRTGFGHTVMMQMTKSTLAGEASLDFAPQGLRWRLACPARHALEL
jgi:PAS domain S-box-containing protein